MFSQNFSHPSNKKNRLLSEKIFTQVSFRRALLQDQWWLLCRSMDRCFCPIGTEWTSRRFGTCQQCVRHPRGRKGDCERATDKDEPSAISKQRSDRWGKLLTKLSMRWTRTTGRRRFSRWQCSVGERCGEKNLWLDLVGGKWVWNLPET